MTEKEGWKQLVRTVDAAFTAGETHAVLSELIEGLRNRVSNIEAQLSKPTETGKCAIKWNRDANMWRTRCGCSMTFESGHPVKYCPFCGKEIA